MQSRLSRTSTRRLRLESLEPRTMLTAGMLAADVLAADVLAADVLAADVLAADVLGVANGLPAMLEQVNGEIMGQLYERASEYGVNAIDLLHVPALQHPLDTTSDGLITPLDALIVINALNDGGAGSVDAFPHGLSRIDVNHDGLVAPYDALLIINGLNDGRFAQGYWWESVGGVNEAVLAGLEHVQSVLADQGLEQAAGDVARISDLVLDHIEFVRQSVSDHLLERGYDQGIDLLLGGLSETQTHVHEHLGFLRDQILEHIDYVRDGRYRDLIPEGELTPETVDAVLDEIGAHIRSERWYQGNETAAWHVNYALDLIEQHKGFAHDGYDVAQIHDLIDTHFDYVVDLLGIHGVEVPDLGDVLTHVHHIVNWVDGLNHDSLVQDGGIRAPLDVHDIPPDVQSHLDSVWNHVGYVRDLIDLHFEYGHSDDPIDWRTLISSHADAIQDLLDWHGVFTGGIRDAIADGIRRWS